MAKLDTLIDTFGGDTLDSSKWSASVDSGISVVVDGALNINIPALTNGSATITSVNTYDLADSYFSIQVISAPRSSEVSHAIQITNNNDVNAYFTIFLENIYASAPSGSVTNIPYNPSVHKFFRIRVTSNIIYFEHSENGKIWNTMYSENVSSFDISNLNVFIKSETQPTNQEDVVAIFDNINYFPIVGPFPTFFRI